MSDFDDDDDNSSLIELEVIKPGAKTLISRIKSIANDTPRSSTLHITELLGILNFTDEDKAALIKARGLVSVQFTNTESGKFISHGKSITIEKIPGVFFFNVSLILNSTVTGDLLLSKDRLSIKNIKGMLAKLGARIKIDEIIITPGKVAIY